MVRSPYQVLESKDPRVLLTDTLRFHHAISLVYLRTLYSLLSMPVFISRRGMTNGSLAGNHHPWWVPGAGPGRHRHWHDHLHWPDNRQFSSDPRKRGGCLAVGCNQHHGTTQQDAKVTVGAARPVMTGPPPLIMSHECCYGLLSSGQSSTQNQGSIPYQISTLEPHLIAPYCRWPFNSAPYRVLSHF